MWMTSHARIRNISLSKRVNWLPSLYLKIPEYVSRSSSSFECPSIMSIVFPRLILIGEVSLLKANCLINLQPSSPDSFSKKVNIIAFYDVSKWEKKYAEENWNKKNNKSVLITERQERKKNPKSQMRGISYAKKGEKLSSIHFIFLSFFRALSERIFLCHLIRCFTS